jgi:formylglycine-generating enzyme required for sulfatase activity/serine/threonine protein kinase
MTDESLTTEPESFFRRRGDDSRDSGETTPGIEPGRVIGDFRLIRKLGEGGMGQVWEAEQISLRRPVALKLMPSRRVLSEARLAMFEREAQAGGRLAQPSIVSVLAYGEAGGIPYIAQELVGDGWSLKDVIQEAQLAHDLPDDWYPRIAKFFAKAADALQVAHDAGVIHRDLKPQNILIADDDRPMIADFGLAKVSGVESISRTGELAGTYCYMSPEQALAKRIGLDHRSDVFSLGATLYESLTLQRPFDGDTQHQVTEAICWEEPDDPRNVRSRVPRDLTVICLKAIEKRRRDRYQSMNEFAADIHRYLRNEPVHAKAASTLLRARKWARRHPVRASSIAITALAVVVISSLAMSLHNESRDLSLAITALAEEKRVSDEHLELAESHRSSLLRLSAAVELDALTAEAGHLWPATPELIPELDDWLQRARSLVATLESRPSDNDVGHRRLLATLALPTFIHKHDDGRALTRHSERVDWDLVQRLVGSIWDDWGKSAYQRPQERAWLKVEMEEQIGPIDSLSMHRIWWINQLAHLVAGVEALGDPQTGLIDGISPEHGWGIARRREYAATVEQRTVSGDEARQRWEEAIASIADAGQCSAYGGLAIAPQLGLLPIGRDPASGLWEFWHVMSGNEPLRDDDGRLLLTESMGVVLVLIPGGTFWMGAQATAPSGRNYDPQALESSSPVHEVEVAPFFLSKYELTQAQWQASEGHNPSLAGHSDWKKSWGASNEGWSALLPVEQVSWEDGTQSLARLGLALPSEAQWEYAARAGTSSVFWSGDKVADLSGVANVADRYGYDHGGSTWSVWESELDDGHTVTAPVGSYRANGFGLQDILGNVWEWCEDISSNSYADAPTDGSAVLESEAGSLGQSSRVMRGGSWYGSLRACRSAYRGGYQPGTRTGFIGLRPAKPLR